VYVAQFANSTQTVL